MKKIFLVLLVLAIIACAEVEMDKTEEIDDSKAIEEVIDEFNGLMEDVEDVILQFKPIGITFKPPVIPVKPPVIPVKPPVIPVKPPVNPVKPPVNPVKPPVNPVKPPVNPVKPPVNPVKPPVIDPRRIPDFKKFGIKLNNLKAKLNNMKLPKIKIGPKTRNFLDKIVKGIGKGIEKLKELGLWEPLIGLAKSFGLQKAGELCSKIIENDEICQKVSDALGQVVDKITGTGESE